MFYSLKWPKSQYRLDKSFFLAILDYKTSFIKPILTFWPFQTIKHLYVQGPFACIGVLGIDRIFAILLPGI